MQFITTGNRIAVENFTLGDLYTITFTNGTYINSACIGIGDNFVTFQRNEPELLFSLTMATAELVSSIDLYAGGTGTNNYNDLTNKPQINDVELVGNKSLSDLGIQPTISDIDTIRSGAAAGATAVQPAALADYQPIISDLDTIRSGATAGATAVQPAALAGYQTIIDSSHKLDADLVDDTTATNKFATAAQLSQIETNKNNILLNNNALCQIINTDSKNMLKLNRDRIKALNANGTWVDYTFTPTAQPNLHITINDDFSITYTGTSSGDFSFAIYAGKLPDVQGYVLSGTTNLNNNFVSLQKSVAPYTRLAKDEGEGAIISEYSNTESLTLNVTIMAQSTDIETTMSPMICKKDYWDITKTYAPYNYIPDYTTCYSTTSNDGTFAAILANATQSKGVSGVISYIASIYTATSNEYLLLYGVFSLNTLHNCVKIVNNTINFVAANNGGTIAVSGGTGTYTVKIKLLI